MSQERNDRSEPKLVAALAKTSAIRKPVQVECFWISYTLQ